MSAKLKPNDVVVTMEMVLRGVDAEDASDWIEEHAQASGLFGVDPDGKNPENIIVPLDFKTAEYVWERRRATRRKAGSKP